MVVLVTCKNKVEIQLENESNKSEHNIILQFLRRSRAANSIVGNGIWLKFNLIQAFIGVLITSNNEEDPFKNKDT